MIFNFGTSLAVMFSAHRLDARFLLLTVLTYMAFTITPFAVLLNFPCEQPGWSDPALAIKIATTLTKLLVVLPSLWLVFYLRKPWNDATSTIR